MTPQLYRHLKDLRKNMAKELDVPPYVIFQDTSLEAMASTYPQTVEELQKYPPESDPERRSATVPASANSSVATARIMRLSAPKSSASARYLKSQLKVDIIRAIDRKIPLDELAKAKGLDFVDLLDHIDAIVYSGTKINIDYFLDDIMDEDSIADIFDYFRESDTDCLDSAYDELGDDYTEDEIRLVRIKFLSEMAN